MKQTGLVDMPYGFLSGALAVAHATLALSAAATWGAFQFNVKSALTLSNLHIFLAKTGTVNAGEVRVDIYSDNAGTPNVSLANVTNAGTLANGWNDFAFSLALSAHTAYWVVIRNLAGTPASNFPTMRWSTNGGGPLHMNNSGTGYNWCKRHSTDSGATWAGATNANIFPAARFDFSSGDYGGIPFESAAVDTTNTIFAARELGNLFTTPANVRLVVTGVTASMFRAGTPTGNLRYRIYKGTTLVATSGEVIPGVIVNAAGMVPGYFSSPVTLEPATAYRFVACESSQSDTTTNSYRLGVYTMENTATSLALKPHNGTVKKTYLNGTWTDTATDFCSMALLLDQDATFYPVATDFAHL
jgi:hypothetical protein